jgi:outer membrane protein assembly factor BamB
MTRSLRVLVLGLLVLLLGMALAPPALAAPAVSLSPTGGPPTSTVSVSGSGFGSFKAIGIYFDETRLAGTVTDGTGSFPGTNITVPGSALPGSHLVTAVQRNGGLTAQAPFLVRTDWPGFRLDPSHDANNRVENVLSPSTVGGLQVKWTAPVLQSYTASSPAVAGGVVYVGSTPLLYALESSTGSTLWTTNLG